jgi:uncharacterized protein YndB with AHSA1/START domain
MTVSTHATFVIERSYPSSPARVFAAWADPRAKASWFSGPPSQWTEYDRSFDFRLGGRESLRGQHQNGIVSRYDAVYFDIVNEERIVYAYEMHLDDRRISVSLATVELFPTDSGTRLVYTEQAVFLDGHDDAGSRERGTRALFEQLGTMLGE